MHLEDRLLSESESAFRAGISVETLRDYSKFGFIEPVKRNSESFYRETELATVFGLSIAASSGSFAEGAQGNLGRSVESDVVVQPDERVSIDREQPLQEKIEISYGEGSEEVSTVADSSEQLERLKKSVLGHTVYQPGTELKQEFAKDSAAWPSVVAGKKEVDLDLFSGQARSAHEESDPFGQVDFDSAEAGIEHESFVARGGEARGSGLVAGLKSEIKQLREERDWLRERLEKLESRSERDQMLLLSESDTVRRLIQSERKKGFFSFALPWFGPNQSSR